MYYFGPQQLHFHSAIPPFLNTCCSPNRIQSNRYINTDQTTSVRARNLYCGRRDNHANRQYTTPRNKGYVGGLCASQQGSIKEQLPDAAIPPNVTSYSFTKYGVLSVLTVKYNVLSMLFSPVFYYEKFQTDSREFHNRPTYTHHLNQH